MATPNEASIPIEIASGFIQDSSFSSRMDVLLNGAAWHVVDQIHDGVGLVYHPDGLALRNANTPAQSDIRIDFMSSALAFRKAKGGGKGELLAKAIGIKGASDYTVIDATAGFGTDAFVLASVGCSVILFERSPLVAALLDDALQRLHADPLGAWLVPRLSLHKGDSKTLLNNYCCDDQRRRPNAIYLDPMFPHRKKSALVKKEMQALQSLLGVDPDADDLLAPAMALATDRVVVKRPSSAPFLGGTKPNMSMNSKKHRFDVYLVSKMSQH
ncbi:class I SAM-dependent methyltransferase [Alteromonas oceanisediminis]|uniref:class I SAM-dependent methyltransferase n=1 Tax=Alteromonas oceanisediminis TaxID=2836180 RepID=UPI001BDAA1BA|nr:class I SAM-dependent methyltransferase [Alteromonas oceanisediminis]MBT0586809.1 class I SAM-dependent methyltransferase [Alteromonas oceanisediminis]